MNCVVCGQSKTRPKWPNIVSCDDCSACFLDPFPSEQQVAALYEREGIFSKPVANQFEDKLFYRRLQALYRQHGWDYRFTAKLSLSRAPARASVLDVGCSTGLFMGDLLTEQPSADIRGIDIDPAAKLNAPREWRDRIEVADIFTYSANQPFDLITLRFVIEHLREPRRHVDRCLELLKPGGTLMISTPDIGSARAIRLRDKWEMVSHPDQKIGHIVWFDKPAMTNLLSSTGFEQIAIQNRGEVIDHLPGWAQRSLYAVFGSHPSGRRPISNFQLRMLWASFVDGWLSERLSVGSCLYAIANKPL